MKLAGFILLLLNALLPPLHLHHHHLSFPTQPFLYISPSSLFALSSSIYCALVSCYSLTLSSPLPPLQHFILLLSIITSTPAITEITTLRSTLPFLLHFLFVSSSLVTAVGPWLCVPPSSSSSSSP